MNFDNCAQPEKHSHRQRVAAGRLAREPPRGVRGRDEKKSRAQVGGDEHRVRQHDGAQIPECCPDDCGPLSEQLPPPDDDDESNVSTDQSRFIIRA